MHEEAVTRTENENERSLARAHTVIITDDLVELNAN